MKLVLCLDCSHDSFESHMICHVTDLSTFLPYSRLMVKEGDVFTLDTEYGKFGRSISRERSEVLFAICIHVLEFLRSGCVKGDKAGTRCARIWRNRGYLHLDLCKWSEREQLEEGEKELVEGLFDIATEGEWLGMRGKEEEKSLSVV